MNKLVVHVKTSCMYTRGILNDWPWTTSKAAEKSENAAKTHYKDDPKDR